MKIDTLNGAVIRMVKVWQEAFAKKKNDEIIQKLKADNPMEKRRRAKNDFHKFVRSL